MALYRIDKAEKSIVEVHQTTFEQQGIFERDDIQCMLKKSIEIISSETLIVSEEFSEWEDSRQRIDLLGIDKDANLIVIELKRTQSGSYMELQALRYAAMISTMTFEKLVPIYQRYLEKNNINEDASKNLLDFLNWSEINEDSFAQAVKIVLVSAGFSKELTTSVMWLNDFGLNIRCVRIMPYINNGEVFLDVQTLIPIPEVAEYQNKIGMKKQKERESRNLFLDRTKFDVRVQNRTEKMLGKGRAILFLVQEILRQGADPLRVKKILNKKFEYFQAILSGDEVCLQLSSGCDNPRKRFFLKEGEILYLNGGTYVLSTQWGADTVEFMSSLADEFSDMTIKIQKSDMS